MTPASARTRSCSIVDHPVEAHEVEHRAARERHRLPVVAGPGPARRDRHAVRVGGAQDGHDLVLRARRDDDLGRDVLELGLEPRRVPVVVAALLLDDARIVLRPGCRRARRGRRQGPSRSLHQVVEFAVVGQRGVDRLAVAQHDAVGLRPRQQLGPGAGAEEDEVGRRADRDRRACRRSRRSSAAPAVDRARPVQASACG